MRKILHFLHFAAFATCGAFISPSYIGPITNTVDFQNIAVNKEKLQIDSINMNSRSQKKDVSKSSYTGLLEYTNGGGFDSYDRPEKGDSIVVDLESNEKISVVVYRSKELKEPRHFNIEYANMKLLEKHEFENIISFDQTIPTGNYNLKFSSSLKNAKDDDYTIWLTHFGDGTRAQLTVIGESDSGVYNLFVAVLTKSK